MSGIISHTDAGDAGFTPEGDGLSRVKTLKHGQMVRSAAAKRPRSPGRWAHDRRELWQR